MAEKKQRMYSGERETCGDVDRCTEITPALFGISSNSQGVLHSALQSIKAAAVCTRVTHRSGNSRRESGVTQVVQFSWHPFPGQHSRASAALQVCRHILGHAGS